MGYPNYIRRMYHWGVSQASGIHQHTKFLLPLDGSLQEQTDIYIVDIIKRNELDPSVQFVNFDVESLFATLPFQEVIDVGRKKLKEDDTLWETTGQSSGRFTEFLSSQIILSSREQILLTEGWLTDGMTSVISYCQHIYGMLWRDSNSCLLFLNVMITGNYGNIKTSVDCKPTHTENVDKRALKHPRATRRGVKRPCITKLSPFARERKLYKKKSPVYEIT